MPTNFRDRASRFLVGAAIGGLAGLLAKDLGLASAASFWHDRSPLVVACALVGAALAMTRLRLLVPLGTAALAAVWCVVAFTPITARLAASLPRRDAVATADAVFVLSSRLQADGELSSASMSRLLRALEVVGEKRAPLLVLSELSPPSRLYADAARPLLAHLGLAVELVTFGPVGNTHDEAIGLARLAREGGWKRVIVVTSPTHSRRACASVEHEGLQVTCVPSTEIGFDLETLGGQDERLRAFESLLHEWIGLRVYRLRGWIDGNALG